MQRELLKLAAAEHQHQRKHASYTSNFAKLSWQPVAASQLSFRIPQADAKGFTLEVRELDPPDGWPAESWLVDENGRFLHQSQGCLTGAERQRQQAAATDMVRAWHATPGQRVVYVSDDFADAKVSVAVVESPVPHGPCTDGWLRLVEAEWLQPYEARFNAVGAGMHLKQLLPPPTPSACVFVDGNVRILRARIDDKQQLWARVQLNPKPGSAPAK